jgi:hypothetical protein
MAQQQVLEHEVLARPCPGQDGREQEPDKFKHAFSIADHLVRGFAAPQRDVFGQHGSEMLLIHDNQVVEALAAERPDDSFDNGVCLWRVDRRRHAVDTDALGAPTEVTAIDGIPIATVLNIMMPATSAPG